MQAIPKYIKDILSRSKYEFDYCTKDKHYAPGYTIRIRKRTTQTLIPTHEKQVKRFQLWVQKQYQKRYGGGNEPISHLLYIPTETHYRDQYAIVTVYDPVMKDIENKIGGN